VTPGTWPRAAVCAVRLLLGSIRHTRLPIRTALSHDPGVYIDDLDNEATPILQRPAATHERWPKGFAELSSLALPPPSPWLRRGYLAMAQ
jgi:hypothetical protein